MIEAYRNWKNTLMKCAIAILSCIVMHACTGTKELKLVAEELETSSTHASEHFANLKNQHTGITKSFNQLHTLTQETYGKFQSQVCNTFTQEAYVSLYKAKLGALEKLDKQYNRALDLIVPNINHGLSGLQSEIDRQLRLIEQNTKKDGITTLQGQYSREIFLALVSERDLLRVQGLLLAITEFQKIMREAMGRLDNYEETQKQEIEKREEQCKANPKIRTNLLAKLGSIATSPEEQYRSVEDYIKYVSLAAKSIKFYTETNSLTDSNGFLFKLFESVITGLTGAQTKQQSDDSPTPKVTSIEEIAVTMPALLEIEKHEFSVDDILKATKLDKVMDSFKSSLSEEVKKISGSVKIKIDDAKNQAKEHLVE